MRVKIFLKNDSKSFDLKSELFLANSGSAVLFSFLVLYLKGISILEDGIALLGILAAISTIVSSTIFGRLVDIRGTRFFLVVGLLASSISSVVYIFSTNFQFLVYARIFHGISLGIFPASITSIASRRKTKLGNLSAFGSLGWANGGLLGGLFAQIFGIKSIFILSALLFFVSFLLSLIFQTGADIDLAPIAMTSKSTEQHSFFDAILLNWEVYLLTIARHGTANAIWIFWALFLQDYIGLSPFEIGLVQLTNTLTQFFVMKTLGDRYNPQFMYFLGLVLSATAFFSFTLAGSLIEMVLTQFILGFSWAFFYVGGLRIVEFRAKSYNLVGTSTGLYNASISIAQVVGPVIGLFFFQISGTYILTMQVAGMVTFIGSIFFGLEMLFVKTKRIEFVLST